MKMFLSMWLNLVEVFIGKDYVVELVPIDSERVSLLNDFSLIGLKPADLGLDSELMVIDQYRHSRH